MPRPTLDPTVILRAFGYGAVLGAASGATLGAAIWFPLGGALGADIGAVLGAVTGLVGGVVLAWVARVWSQHRPLTLHAARLLGAFTHAGLVAAGCLAGLAAGAGLGDQPLRAGGDLLATAVLTALGYVAGPVLILGPAKPQLARRALHVMGAGLVAGAVAGGAVGLGFGIHDAVTGGFSAGPAVVPAAIVEGGLFGIGPGGVLGIMVVAGMVLPRLRAASPPGPPSSPPLRPPSRPPLGAGPH